MQYLRKNGSHALLQNRLGGGARIQSDEKGIGEDRGQYQGNEEPNPNVDGDLGIREKV